MVVMGVRGLLWKGKIRWKGRGDSRLAEEYSGQGQPDAKGLRAKHSDTLQGFFQKQNVEFKKGWGVQHWGGMG